MSRCGGSFKLIKLGRITIHHVWEHLGIGVGDIVEVRWRLSRRRDQNGDNPRRTLNHEHLPG